MIAAAVRAVCAFARQACARHCQHREAKSTYDTLRELDDRTLHDLGLDRTEVMSIAAELTGQAEHMRLRASDVAPSSDCSSSVMPGAEVAIPATGRTNRVGKVTVHRYETSIPRVVCAFTAVAMAGITMGVLVIVPAIMGADLLDPDMPAASRISTQGSTSAVSDPAIDFVAMHRQVLVSCPCTAPKAKPGRYSAPQD